MKRLIIGGLSVVLLSAVAAPAVRAESPTDNPASSSSTPTVPSFELQPFNLVYMAYQGYFEEQGIPSAQGLISAYRTGTVDAEDIVESAVKANRLPSSVMADDDYLNAVELQLRSLDDRS
ncbi:hypothetical protein H6S82_28695 [Planktothrix sp. FACHB-1355]|uniref:Uncharacterized protein n=1 Tax=Aerosakkonema funiforme FACHB-1375 TaxID=2949571 RepID=A0A926ZFI7_9CYAN|nr:MULTISPECIES: hypothetical protein [Oscillatoriales]MBD2181178.1 hypothetical protein [Aerosakkonema funiforme FACHB-1375]MBD3562792.1 hypothetical protein [Planktothrix sp. FACHB-1355]